MSNLENHKDLKYLRIGIVLLPITWGSHNCKVISVVASSFRAVTKGSGAGEFHGCYKHDPWIPSLETQGKLNSINRTLVVYHLQKLSRKSVWKVNGTRPFRSLVSVEHIPEQWNVWKGSLLVLPVAISKQTFVFHFFKAIFDTGFSFPRLFFGITVTV